MQIVYCFLAVLVASATATPQRSRTRLTRPTRAPPRTSAPRRTVTQTQRASPSSRASRTQVTTSSTVEQLPLITVPVLDGDLSYNANAVYVNDSSTYYEMECLGTSGILCPGPSTAALVTVAPSTFFYQWWALDNTGEGYDKFEQYDCTLPDSTQFSCDYYTYTAQSTESISEEVVTQTSYVPGAVFTITAGAELLDLDNSTATGTAGSSAGSQATGSPLPGAGALNAGSAFSGLFGMSDRCALVVSSAFAFSVGALSFLL